VTSIDHVERRRAARRLEASSFEGFDLRALESSLDEGSRAIVEQRRDSGLHRRGWLVRRALLVADGAGLVVAFALSLALFPAVDVPWDRISTLTEIALFAVTLPVWIVLMKLYGLYDRDEERTDHTTVDDVFGVFNVVTVGTFLFVAGSWVTELMQPTTQRILTFWLASIALVALFRATARSFCRSRPEYVQNTVVLGAGSVGQKVARKLLRHPEYGVNLLGLVDDRPRERGDDLGSLTLLGETAQLPKIVEALRVERVVVAFAEQPDEDTLELVRRLGDLDVQIDVVPRLFEVVGPSITTHGVEGLTLLALPRAKLSRSALAAKRMLDVVVSALGLLVMAPLFAVVALTIRLDSPGPVLFRQARAGQNGGYFSMFKFRTMTLDAEARKREVAHLNKHRDSDPRMFKVPNDPRVTRIGRLLRRYSLDELPQLWNVLRGEMSLVGPRPLILDEHRHVEGWRERRVDLKPGITGLWQVLGRDGIPFEEMVELDYRYVTTWSLLGDLKLIARTIPAVAKGGTG
jgi:exopolysaccharide biosynthesis polyprenyl glycosylphosphotransferase